MDSARHLQRNVGRVIKNGRIRLRLSQEEFAARAGLNRTYIGSIERGERNLSLRNLVRVASALGIATSSLLLEAESLSSPSRPKKPTS